MTNTRDARLPPTAALPGRARRFPTRTWRIAWSRRTDYRSVSVDLARGCHTLWLVDELLPPRCERCGAVVARALMRFHRDWHTTQGERGRQFWEAPSEPSLNQLMRLVAVLTALPPVAARPDFVAELRVRLMAEASRTETSSLNRPGMFRDSAEPGADHSGNSRGGVRCCFVVRLESSDLVLKSCPTRSWCPGRVFAVDR